MVVQHAGIGAAVSGASSGCQLSSEELTVTCLALLPLKLQLRYWYCSSGVSGLFCIGFILQASRGKGPKYTPWWFSELRMVLLPCEWGGKIGEVKGKIVLFQRCDLFSYRA